MPIVKARAKTHLDLRRNTQILEETIALDGLTNIANRLRFKEILEKERKQSL
ncbi:MAG: hypothetical protein SVY10_21570 [Thermodesulfobacteriota bacterium]|nr:hypothetical protein [Thermodesulfobacteriota bacterium]